MIRANEVFKIGIFNKPHGIHGELSFTFTDDIFDRVDCDYLICLIDGIFVPFFLEEYRFRSDSTALVKLEGVDSSEHARQFTNTDVYFPLKYAENTGQAEPGWELLIGFEVEDLKYGPLGKITEVDTSTINTLFNINDGISERMIPAQDDLVHILDYDQKRIIMDLPEGLIDSDLAESDDD